MKEPYVVIRADRAGVFAGNLAKRNGGEVTLHNARRIWYWDGAASITQIAVSGVTKPENCKFSMPASEQIVLGVIEIITTTKEAEANIKAVPVWKK
jgi:hypothetical protein